MFCLNSLSDSLTDEPSEDDALEELFGSPLFTLLSESQASIPLKARRTAVNLIGTNHKCPSLFIFTNRATRFLCRLFRT